MTNSILHYWYNGSSNRRLIKISAKSGGDTIKRRRLIEEGHLTSFAFNEQTLFWLNLKKKEKKLTH